jgi:hypothetical protein
MTIGIATPRKIVADRAANLGSIYHLTKKIIRFQITEGRKKRTALLMTAGDSILTWRFECALRASNMFPEPDELNQDETKSFEAVLVTERSVTYYDNAYAPFEFEWVAIGVGSAFARGLMVAGMSPEDAVRQTCQHVAGCALLGMEPDVETL